MTTVGDRFTHGPIELRFGDWRTALADVETCDAVITDPPYSARTHDGQRHGRVDKARGVTGNEWLGTRGLGYASWGALEISEFVERWRVARGWLCAFHSHDQRADYAASLELAGRYVFAPLACVQKGMNIRLAGDGPSNWTTWLTVSRPRTGPIVRWGTLPGAYVGYPFDPGQNMATATRRTSVVGSKPLWLMRCIIRDYTRPGDLVVDPCAGGATTLIAAAIEGRRAIGSEIDPETFDKAVKRIKAGYTPSLLDVPRADQVKTIQRTLHLPKGSSA